MSGLRQYFETDFGHAIRVHGTVRLDGETIEVAVLYDFEGFNAFLALYVAGNNRPIKFFLELVQHLELGRTPVELGGKVTLPGARSFIGKMQICQLPQFEVLACDWSSERWVSTGEMRGNGRVYIYSETDLAESAVANVRAAGKAVGLDVQLRLARNAADRAAMQKPLAFICHDSRDKDEVARKIAVKLQSMACPVWYDEFSLKPGDRLRESIEKGLKECRKCIVVLSANFLANRGWTRAEFDSIFTREVLQEKRLVLPVWYGVTKHAIYDYSPGLLDVVGLDWEKLGDETVCRRLLQSIID